MKPRKQIKDIMMTKMDLDFDVTGEIREFLKSKIQRPIYKISWTNIGYTIYKGIWELQ
jgi:hypothetical protein